MSDLAYAGAPAAFLSFLIASAFGVQILDNMRFEDTRTKKPVSKFRARMLHSRGELDS